MTADAQMRFGTETSKKQDWDKHQNLIMACTDVLDKSS